MWKLNKSGLIILLWSCVSAIGIAQDCNFRISGKVTDESSGRAISYANVYIAELQKGVFTDSLGFYKLESICLQKYHLIISHIGCETVERYVKIEGDSTLNFSLDHSSHIFKELTISAQKGGGGTQENESIGGDEIAQNREKNFAEMLHSIAGVSSIKNGSGIAKPVVHGLYGNRLTILNNGLQHSGQQWGADHGPEIDPQAGDNITVIKGAASLQYPGSNLGSVVLISQDKIEAELHLHGKGSYTFESNGRGHALNLSMKQSTRAFSWRAVGSLKRSGDNRSPSYFLRNTGEGEGHFAIQMEKSLRKNWQSDLYFSTFNAELGILRGSHIGNLTDLEAAIGRSRPYFTEEDFSYALDAPFQRVNHHLLKFHSNYDLLDGQRIDFSYGLQFNKRREYDVRRSGRTELPALSLRQFSQELELVHRLPFGRDWLLKSGLQAKRIWNENLPETGILPLIPDYLSHRVGVFSVLNKSFGRSNLEFGARWDLTHRDVAAISRTVPREILQFQNYRSNAAALIGINHRLSKYWKIALNIGLAERIPAINELYSFGLHQGVSGIEEGDPELDTEKSLKGTVALHGSIGEKLFLETFLYAQRVDSYIYLRPEEAYRLTIRGAFPVFKYTQSDGLLYGFDFSGKYQINDYIDLSGEYSFLRGEDLEVALPIINLPSNNLSASMRLTFPSFLELEKPSFRMDYRYVFKQSRLRETVDFLPPPDAYSLLGFSLSAEKQVASRRLGFNFKVENILNTTYRDYLDRQRYFADAEGINFVCGIQLQF